MKKFAALLLSATTLLTLCACNVAPEFEEETTEGKTEILTDLPSEMPTKEPETIVTRPSVELPEWPIVKDPDPTDTQALAMQAYWDLLTREDSCLKDMKTPYGRTPLRELDSIGYALVDFGGDGVDELVIDCGDTLIFRYYEGKLYSYEFTFRNLYYLTTDGSRFWNHTGSDFVYGENQIFFDEERLASKELWRIVNEGEPNAEYYIEGKPVSQSEILQYFEANSKTNVTFSTFEAPWKNPVSAAEAYRLANAYWERFEIGKNGYHVERGTNSWAPDSVYVFVIRQFVVDHYSTFDEIWIDVNTGEAIVPYAPDGK